MIVQQVNVQAVVIADVVVIPRNAFAKIQERLMQQYSHQGRRGAYTRDLTEYEVMVEQGRQIAATLITTTNNATEASKGIM